LLEKLEFVLKLEKKQGMKRSGWVFAVPCQSIETAPYCT